MRIPANLRLWCVFCAYTIPFCLQARAELSFEANLGQTAPENRYLARTSSGVIFITDQGITLNEGPSYELLDANLSTEWTPQGLTGETISYFVGRDPSKWVRDAPRYERLVRRNVYPGVDLVLYGAGRQLEYDFVLAPHADPSRIRLKLTAARTVSIDADGALVVDALRHRKPVLMETLPDGSRRSLAGAFQILGRDEVGFSVNGHDPALALSIDPVLESSTYFGGNGDDQIVATDGNGTLVGMTTSIDLPGAPFMRPKGTNLFVALGQQTIVIGCTGNVTVTSAAFNSSYNETVAVGGYTGCTDLPTNLGYAYLDPPTQTTYGGGATDGFVLVMNLQYETPFRNNLSLSYVGGPGDDRVNAVAIDSSGLLAMAGSTNGGGLPQPMSGPSVQSKLAGGLDAFVITGVSDVYGRVSVDSTTYLGGSADDIALGVAIFQGVVYVTGETESPDFPLVNPLYSKRQGASDAFIAVIGTKLTASTLFGGSGSDQGVAVTVLPSGNVAVAGVTSSPDLPLKNPIQKAYGGGASDAFVAQFTPDLSALISSTYIGGSGADQATSIASSFPNTLFVGGWTASADFPTVNPLQSKFGGGPDDGFLVHFDDDGSVYEATYFGGSGSDQILGVTGASIAGLYGPFGPTVWVVGTTSSPNLPLQNATQSSLSGTSNGFVAEITADVFSIAPFIGGKDLRSRVTIIPGNQQLVGSTTFTISSSDASMVQVAADTVSPGESSAVNSGSATFYADCLTDSGSADLTISAPGYGSKTITATCLPPAILVSVQLPSGTPGPLQTNIGVAANITLSAVVKNPQTGSVVSAAGARPGAAPLTIQITDSNPNVGSISASSVTLVPLYSTSITFTALAIGATDLTFSAGSIPILPSSSVPVTVGGSYFAPQPFALPAGFQARIYLQAVSANQPGNALTVTSHNPAQLVLSLDPTQKGTGSVTLSAANPLALQPIWVQALASSGHVLLTISGQGEPDITTTVQLTTPVATLLYGTNDGQAIQLPVGGAAYIGIGISGAVPAPNTLATNPGSASITFSLQPSDTGTVKITPASIQLAPSAFIGSTFQITGLTAGTAVLTLANSAKIPDGAPFPSVTVNVAQKPVTFPDVEVGNNLSTTMTLSLPTPAASDVVVTATISDPTLALLSLDATSPGLAQLTFIIPGGQSVAQFYVYGLASSGQPKVTATITGYGSVTANVNLDRSGFYWTQDGQTVNAGASNSFTASVVAGPLDAASGLPVGLQNLRPGVAATVGISNSNSKVVTLNSSQLTFPAGPALQITPTASGTATLTLQQPSGFSAPSVRQKFVVNIPESVLTLYPFTLGKNTQIPFGLSGVARLTLTSSDPSKVLISTDPGKLGSGSVTVTGQTVYLQGLASSGTVMLKASAPGYSSVSSLITLVPTGLGIAFDQSNNAVTYNGVKYSTTTQSVAVNIVVNLIVGTNPQASGTFLPLPALTAKITSSNPAVAAITGGAITIPVQPTQGFNGLATATELPVGPGETIISISQPAGFSSVGNDSLTLDVVAPSLVMNNLTVAKNTLSAAGGVNLPQGLNPLSANLAVTVTSSDPSRILLSPDATTPPAASITVAIAPGFTGANFYLEALSDNGAVAINATAPGYANSSSMVQLFPLAFGFVGPASAVVQAGPQPLQVVAGALYPNGVFNNANSLTLRPGVGPITVGVKSSDPTIVSVSPAQIIFQSYPLSAPPITFTPLKAGTVTISMTVPAGYATTGPLTIITAAGTITPGNSTLQLGRDLQTSIYFSVQAPTPNQQVTVTSSDPSRVLVSANLFTPGQSKVTVPAEGIGVFVQALSGSGNVTLFFSSPGYETASMTVNLVPTGAVFPLPLSYEQGLFTGAGVEQIPVALAPLDPVSLLPGTPQTMRPGVSLSVAVTSSDPSVVTVTTPTVQFSLQPDGTSQSVASVQPAATGTSIVTLAPLAGSPTPASQNQIVFTVSAPAPSASAGVK
jgi:hypothetical protein